MSRTHRDPSEAHPRTLWPIFPTLQYVHNSEYVCFDRTITYSAKCDSHSLIQAYKGIELYKLKKDIRMTKYYRSGASGGTTTYKTMYICEVLCRSRRHCTHFFIDTIKDACELYMVSRFFVVLNLMLWISSTNSLVPDDLLSTT